MVLDLLQGRPRLVRKLLVQDLLEFGEDEKVPDLGEGGCDEGVDQPLRERHRVSGIESGSLSLNKSPVR